MRQEPLPDVESLPPPPKQELCSWCNAKATTEVEIRPTQYRTNHHGKRVVRRPALRVAACQTCKLRIENSMEKK